MAKHVIKDLEDRVDLILDSGPTTIGIESTVLDLSGDRPRVLRPGEVTRERSPKSWASPSKAPAIGRNPAAPPGARARWRSITPHGRRLSGWNATRSRWA